MHHLTAFALLQVVSCLSDNIPKPPSPEPIEIVELPLPPVISTNTTGSCTLEANPRGTGCINQERREGGFAGGDFHPDGNHVIANVVFIGAPAAPDPSSVYSGEQLIIIKVDGTTFSNGDSWKCLSCAVPPENARSLDPQTDYPHVFRSGDKALWGHNILDCGEHQLTSDDCTPESTHIYPIHWNTAVNGSGKGGAFREVRLHPDDRHFGWSSFTAGGGQNAYFGLLKFNPNPSVGIPLAPRYDLVEVNLLRDLTRDQYLTSDGEELHYEDDAIVIGELRGFSGTGDEILYVGPTREANNVDVFAVHVLTGAVRRLTRHHEYVDPVAFSADNEWMVVMDTRGTDRQTWMSGMRHVPPLIDVVTSAVASSTRNNGLRRFFQPFLIDGFGDRGDYYGQQVNGAGNGSNGAPNDSNWNGRADPAFSLDGTKIVYWQTLVVDPECGGANPLPCPISSAPGQAEYRFMVARLHGRAPKTPPPAFKVPTKIPWAFPFPPGAKVPVQNAVLPGNYVLRGKASGIANVQLIGEDMDIHTVAVSYDNFSDDGSIVLNGFENVTETSLPPNVWNRQVDWFSDLTQSGAVNVTKKTSASGFHLQIDVLVNLFNATGSLTTTIEGIEYKQPENFT